MTEVAHRDTVRRATDAAISSVGSALRDMAAPSASQQTPPNSFHRPMITDLDWEMVKVYKLRPGQIISVYGKELVVNYCEPAERGGDFYLLEAHEPHYNTLTGPSSVLSLELDRSTTALAREDTP